MNRRLFMVVSVIALVLSAVGPVAARDGLRVAGGLTAGETIQGMKSLSGSIAQSDKELLARTDGQLVNVIIKFDLDATASYQGGVANLKATSPAKTGKALKQNKAAVAAYEKYLANESQSIKQAMKDKVASLELGTTFTTAYAGVAATLPANKAKALLKVDGVAAVQADTLAQPLTDASPAFIGAEAAWTGLGGSATAGDGVIVGVLDTGIWPEHPSFTDHGNLSSPPGTYGCEFGNGSDPALGAAFTCNDKLIGAYAKTATYMANINALPGEFCNNTTDQCSARDADGHGTHTSSTAAGGPVEDVVLLGVNRGDISGMAPGAHVIMYRVCLTQGCFGSDSVSAVQQAITDGVDVLNFSISGGNNAYTDAVELAFLDAYAAGILVNASAGNAGPGAGTANHAGPWTNTVAASTSDRHFLSTLQLTADGGATLNIPGVTVTAGIAPMPVVRASAAPYSDAICNHIAPAGTFTGKIVICDRGVNARVDKGFNVLQGGAVGMILTNVTEAASGLNSDNHWLPSIHTEFTSRTAMLDFLTANTNVLATWASGTATPVQGDVMTSFSSRGPLGDFIKPDVTAPGIQILAGHSPQHVGISTGPQGELYQAIAGTSMSSPHSAGVSALIKAAHPGWTPGQIKSALMTSSLQAVLKHDGATPADPFDRGAGSIRADRSLSPTVTFDVSPADYYASATDPLGRINLNLPSINAPVMAGAVTTWRTATNVTGKNQELKISTLAPAGSSITVEPKHLHLKKGESKTFSITIDGTALAEGQYFGQITLDTKKKGLSDAVLPVAFFKRDGGVTLSHSCADTTLAKHETTSCEVSATNLLAADANVNLSVQGPKKAQDLAVHNQSDGTTAGNGFTWSGTLAGAQPPTINSITPTTGPAGGYLPLSVFGAAPISAGDDTITNFNVPTFYYGGEPYTSVGVVSNGYVIVGGGVAADVVFTPQNFPNAARPNNVLALLWSDLNPAGGGGAGNIRIIILTDGSSSWLAIDYGGVKNFSNATTHSMEMWLRLEGGGAGSGPASEEITLTYGTANTAAPDPGSGGNSGAENRAGSSGQNLVTPANNTEWRVNTSPPAAGGTKTITYDATAGKKLGTYDILASMTSDITQGTAKKVVSITVE